MPPTPRRRTRRYLPASSRPCASDGGAQARALAAGGGVVGVNSTAAAMSRRHESHASACSTTAQRTALSSLSRRNSNSVFSAQSLDSLIRLVRHDLDLNVSQILGNT